LTEWNEAANVGTLYVCLQFRQMIIEKLKPDSRTGLPPSITDPYDSASDSEEEDEADEDSNGQFLLCFCFYTAARAKTLTAEEYYKNDYPDEEDSSDQDDSGGSLLSLSHLLYSHHFSQMSSTKILRTNRTKKMNRATNGDNRTC
jgi:hypothetical protein